jgi:hypothetical protein
MRYSNYIDSKAAGNCNVPDRCLRNDGLLKNDCG